MNRDRITMPVKACIAALLADQINTSVVEVKEQVHKQHPDAWLLVWS
jgi:hypothetical protein